MNNLELCELYKKTKNIKYRNKLIINNYSLVKLIARKLYVKNKFDNLYDLYSYGILGLIKSIEEFDIKKSSNISAYFYYKIRNYIIDEMRKNEWIKYYYRRKFKKDIRNQYSHFNPIISLEDNEYLLETIKDNNYDVEKNICNIETKEEILKSLSHLNNQEKKVIELYFYEELSQSKIANIMNLTKSRISQIYIRALQKLKSFQKSY